MGEGGICAVRAKTPIEGILLKINDDAITKSFASCLCLNTKCLFNCLGARHPQVSVFQCTYYKYI